MLFESLLRNCIFTFSDMKYICSSIFLDVVLCLERKTTWVKENKERKKLWGKIKRRKRNFIAVKFSSFKNKDCCEKIKIKRFYTEHQTQLKLRDVPALIFQQKKNTHTQRERQKQVEENKDDI